jgi:hypothetical protein
VAEGHERAVGWSSSTCGKRWRAAASSQSGRAEDLLVVLAERAGSGVELLHVRAAIEGRGVLAERAG